MKHQRIHYKSCPLCGGRSEPRLHVDWTRHTRYDPRLPDTIEWHQCVTCDHVHTSGYFDDSALSVIFEKTINEQKVGEDVEYQRWLAAKLIEKVLPHRSDGRWLDVGFGNGALLLTAREYGFEPVGIDIRPENVERLQELGIDAKQCQIDDMRGSFHVISLCDVLEHIHYPESTLNHARHLIASDGVLVVSCPNSEAASWQQTEPEANPYWREIEHCHNFSKARLYALLRECGFEPVRYGISERYYSCMEILARPV